MSLYLVPLQILKFLYAFIKWGEKAFDLLKGMFSCCIYDKFERIVYIVRDPLGIKPLYYSFLDEKNIILSSEIKGIKPFKENLSPNKSVINEFIINRSTDYDIHTFYNEIFQIKPGFMVRHELGSDNFSQFSFSNIFENNSNEHFSKNYLIEKAEHILQESINLSLSTDVPLGCYFRWI